MIAKLRVFSGALTHASAGETFWPVQFAFFAKLPAAFGGSIELSGMPGEVSRKAVGGTAGSCVVAQPVSTSKASVAAVVFMTRESSRCQWYRPSPGLISLDARKLDHPCPLCCGFGEDRSEFRRRAPNHCAAQLDDSGLGLAVGETGIEFLVQHGDDFGRGVPGRADARKTAGLVTSHEVSHRRKIRERVQTGCGRYRKGAQLAGLDVWDRFRHRSENHLHVAGDQG